MTLDRTREVREARLFPDALHVFELGASAFALRAEPEYLRSGRTGLTLVKNPDLRIVVEVLREGARLPEHHAPGPVALHVLDGEVRVDATGEVVYLRGGEVLSIPSGRPHAVEAVRDCAFLLTIAPEGQLTAQ